MAARDLRVSWSLAAWAALLAGPSAAVAFVLGSTPPLHCDPKRACLRESVEAAWIDFELRIAGVVALCALLWAVRRALGPITKADRALLRAILACAAFSAVSARILLAGMNAVIDSSDSVTAILPLAIGGTVILLLFFRELRGIA